MIKKSFFIVGISLILFACNSNEESVKTGDNTEISEQYIEENPNVFISGVLENGSNTTLVLEHNTPKGFVLINKAITDEDGKFILNGKIEDIGLYQLRLEDNTGTNQTQNIIPLTLVPEDVLTLTLDFDNFNNSVVYSGTEWADALNGYMREFNKFIDWQKSIKNPERIDQNELIELILDNKKPMDSYIVEEINKNPANPANILLMTNILPIMGFDHYDINNLSALSKMSDAYSAQYPDRDITLQIVNEIKQLEQSLKDYKDFKENNQAPEIALPNPQGKEMTLSSLRGNYVLIDFWAAWCPPCRAENPNVVRLYNKYKSKNFKIFSVSLDDNKADWEKAIKDDGLIWEHHVSDLLKWRSPMVEKYQFNGIPHTVFIDPEGKIIAKNLRGPSLERKLQEIFGN